MSVSPDAFSTCNESSVRVVDPATLLRLTLRSPANQPAPTLSMIAFGCDTEPVPTTVNLPSLSTVSLVAGVVSPLMIWN